MTRPAVFRLSLACSLLALLVGCSRDPNVRKQKYFESGQHYFSQGKFAEAAIQFRNAIQIDPQFEKAHYELSRAYLRLRDPKDAYTELNNAVNIDPNDFRARTDLANLLIATRNPDNLKEAKTHLDVLREKQPNTPETHEAWAEYDSTQNNLPAAIQEMQQAVALDPNRSESYVTLAIFQLGSKMPDQAETNFKKAVQLDPKNMLAQLDLGSFYQAQNRMPEAEQQYKHAIDVDPKNPAPRVAFIRLLMAEGKRAETEAFAQQCKKDLPDTPEAYAMLGDFYFSIGDLDRATAEYASLFSEHPKDSQVKKNYIELLILKGRYDEAAKLNNDVLKSNPNDVDALVRKGQMLLNQNDVTGAIDSLQTALRDDKDNGPAHYQLGLAFARQHNEASAESEWRKAVSLRPDMVDAQTALAAVEMDRNDVDGLMQTAGQIIAAEPNSPDGYILRGVAEVARQRYAEAQQDTEQALQKAPQSPAPYFRLGNIQLAQKHYGDAEKFYQQALDKDPSFALALSGLMNAYLSDKQPDKAFAAVNAQIAKSPNNSGFYDLLGTVLYNSKKDMSGAETALRKAVALDKNNNDALEKLGKVLVAEGSMDQALALYQQALKDNPGNVRLYILSGEFYEQKKDWDHAKQMYQQALNIQPDHPLASNNLAYVMLEQGGNVDVALAMAQAARRGLPDSATVADTLGWAYYHKGIYQSAINQFQEALKLAEKSGAPDDANNANVHYHLGLAYEKANQISQARQQLEKAIKMNPNNADAKKALSELKS